VKTLQAALGKKFGRGKISYPSERCSGDRISLLLGRRGRESRRCSQRAIQSTLQVAAETGAHAGELYALTVDDLLFIHKVIRINKSMYNQRVGSPKTRNATRWSTSSPKHLHPLLRKLGLERGGMHGFRHHRVSTLALAGMPIGLIRKWIGHGSDERVNRYTHLRPDFMQSELERVPDFITKITPQIGTKNDELVSVDPHAKVAA
jgi:integrase